MLADFSKKSCSNNCCILSLSFQRRNKISKGSIFSSMASVHLDPSKPNQHLFWTRLVGCICYLTWHQQRSALAQLRPQSRGRYMIQIPQENANRVNVRSCADENLSVSNLTVYSMLSSQTKTVCYQPERKCVHFNICFLCYLAWYYSLCS